MIAEPSAKRRRRSPAHVWLRAEITKLGCAQPERVCSKIIALARTNGEELDDDIDDALEQAQPDDEMADDIYKLRCAIVAKTAEIRAITTPLVGTAAFATTHRAALPATSTVEEVPAAAAAVAAPPLAASAAAATASRPPPPRLPSLAFTGVRFLFGAKVTLQQRATLARLMQDHGAFGACEGLLEESEWKKHRFLLSHPTRIARCGATHVIVAPNGRGAPFRSLCVALGAGATDGEVHALREMLTRRGVHVVTTQWVSESLRQRPPRRQPEAKHLANRMLEIAVAEQTTNRGGGWPNCRCNVRARLQAFSAKFAASSSSSSGGGGGGGGINGRVQRLVGRKGAPRQRVDQTHVYICGRRVADEMDGGTRCDAVCWTSLPSDTPTNPSPLTRQCQEKVRARPREDLRFEEQVRAEQRRDQKPQELDDILPSHRYSNVPNPDKSKRSESKNPGRLNDLADPMRSDDGTTFAGADGTVLIESRDVVFNVADDDDDDDDDDVERDVDENHHTMKIVGPRPLLNEFWHYAGLRLFEHWWAKPRPQRIVEVDVAYPIFLFSRGRASQALVNLRTPHALGAWKRGALNTVVIVVVDPLELKSYQKRHPSSLFLALPESGRSVGYARFCVRRFCKTGRSSDGAMLRLPWYWAIDDSICEFRQLRVIDHTKTRRLPQLIIPHPGAAGAAVATSASIGAASGAGAMEGVVSALSSSASANAGAGAGASAASPSASAAAAAAAAISAAVKTTRARTPYKEVVEHEGEHPMFLAAFLAVQHLPDLAEYSQVGFCRDRGPALFYRRSFSTGSLSIYKIVLNNLDPRNIRGDYVQRLTKWEDLQLTNRIQNVLDGPPTLKLYDWTYRAITLRGGGCASARQRDGPGTFGIAGLLEAKGPAVLKDWETDDVKTLERWVASKSPVQSEAAAQAAAAAYLAPKWEWGDEEEEDGAADGTHAPPIAAKEGDLTVKLYPHQQEALRILSSLERGRCDITGVRGGILAHGEYLLHTRRFFSCSPSHSLACFTDMGLGKTLTAIALIISNTPPAATAAAKSAATNGSRARRAPTLVVCPLSLMTQWSNELTKRAPRLTQLIWYDPAMRRGVLDTSGIEVTITTYDTLKRDTQLRAAKWYRIVIDESHTIKNEKAEVSKMCLEVARKATCRLCISGTPIVNSAADLLTQLVCIGVKRDMALASLPQVLDRVLIMRSKEDLIAQQHATARVAHASGVDPTAMGIAPLRLPRKVFWLTTKPFATDEEASLSRVLLEIALNPTVEERKRTYADALTLLTRLRQAAGHPVIAIRSLQRSGRLPKGDEIQKYIEQRSDGTLSLTGIVHFLNEHAGASLTAEEPGRDGDELALTSNFPSTKCDMILAKLETILRSSNGAHARIVIFSCYKDLLTILESRLTRVLQGGVKSKGGSAAAGTKMTTTLHAEMLRLDGDTSERDRVARVQRFQSSADAGGAAAGAAASAPGAKVFFMSIQAGGVGINLSMSTHLLICDPCWHPCAERQAIDRAHRMCAPNAELHIDRFLIERSVEIQVCAGAAVVVCSPS